MPPSAISDKNTILFLFSSLQLLLIAFWYWGFDGYYFFDDMDYAHYAHALSQGHFAPDESLFSHRVAVIFSAAFFYRLFGYSDITTNLAPLCWTLLSLHLLFWSFYRRHAGVALMVSVLFVLDFYTIFFSNKLYPDALVCTATLTAACAVWKARNAAEKRIYARACVFSISLWVAFLAKVTVCYTAPFFLLLFMYDVIRKKHTMFWYTSILVLGMLLLLTALYYQQQFGDVFYRFKAINQGHYVSADSYFDKDYRALLHRLTYQPLLMMIQSGLMVVFMMAFPALAGYRRGKWWQYTGAERFWVGYAAGVLLFFWFGSTTLQYYNPIALFGRHLLLLVPPLAVLGGKRLYALEENIGMYSILSIGVTLTAFWIQAGNMAYLYLLLTLLFVVYSLSRHRLPVAVARKGALLLFTAILALHPVYSMCRPSATGYRALKSLLLSRQRDMQHALLVTDLQSCTHLGHFFDWGTQPACVALTDPQLQEQVAAYREVYLMVYRYLLYPDQQEALQQFLQHFEGQPSVIEEQTGFTLYRLR